MLVFHYQNPTQIKMDKLIPGWVIQQLSCPRQVKYLILVVPTFTCNTPLKSAFRGF